MITPDKQNLPSFEQVMIPLLHALKELGGSASIDELDSKAAEIMTLPDDVLEIQHKGNAGRSEVSYRLAWARTYLKKYGIIENSSRGIWTFSNTFSGDISSLSPKKIVKHVREINKERDALTVVTTDDEGDVDDLVVAEEVVEWQDRLREVLLKMPADAFERLTLRILRESGFAHVEVTGRSGDNGIDGKGIFRFNGIISFHMIFQCKRYRNSVSPSEMRDFRGAMQGRADKGLFITTGSFTAAAKKEATRDGAPAIDLIDGDALIEKLKELGLGVKEKIVIEYEIDENWFVKI